MHDLRLPTTHRVAGPTAADDRLVQLAYELLDAHDDTARLAAPFADELRWRAHLDYLRDLQRAGRGLLAHAQVGSGRDPSASRHAPMRQLPW